jgi:CDP-diacylglycerol--glycerol-3-phosphate 3-phosphatidyltransferase
MSLTAEKRREYFNLPNYLTLGRILLIPVVMVLLAQIDSTKNIAYNQMIGLIASGVFIIAGLSDLVDGYFARKYKINSIFGKYFDPLADKLMVLAVMIMMVPMERIPAWIVVVFLAREIIVTALRGIATGEGMELPADEWGKKKTLLQNIALVALMIHYPLWGVSGQKFGWIVLWMALVLAILSGANYIWRFSRSILQRYQG